MNLARYLSACADLPRFELDQPQVYSVRVRFIEEDQDGNEFEDYTDVSVKAKTSHEASKAAMEYTLDLTVSGTITRVISGEAKSVPHRRVWNIEARNGKIGSMGELFR